MSHSRRQHIAAGFTLIEVLIAVLLLISVAAGVMHLIGVSTAATRAARDQTTTTILAASKLEQLRSLTWSFEPGPNDPPVARSDHSADLSHEPQRDGGPGLSAGAGSSLQSNVPPYVDYLDDLGRWVGNGPSPPADAAFIRRWSVRPLPEDPAHTLVLSVLVTTVAQERSRRAAWNGRGGTEALLVLVRTRKGRA
jgi:prepilin-type N-terminal cleavage/methylation domain-containing protein